MPINVPATVAAFASSEGGGQIAGSTVILQLPKLAPLNPERQSFRQLSASPFHSPLTRKRPGQPTLRSRLHT